MTEPWGGTDLPSALKGLPGAFWCCGGARPLLCGRLKGTASATTSRWKHSSGILGLLPSMVGAPEHKNLLLHEWGAPKCNGMFLAGTDAAGHNGVLLALRDAPGSRDVPGPEGCSWPQGCSHPRGARRGAAGQAQGAVDGRQLLPQTLHFPLRCLRPLQGNKTGIRPASPHPTRGPGSAPIRASPEHPAPTSSIISPAQVFKLPPRI